MQILLAGPGTGKTSKVKRIIKEGFSEAENIKIISFTNATVKDLKESFLGQENVTCSTLHGFALSLNHLPEIYILCEPEEKILKSLSTKLGIEFVELCEMLGCITYEGMIRQCVNFVKANPVYATDKIGILDLLLIDEFQDFNEIERELVTLASGIAAETIILGDDDQCIYGFKDADPDAIIALFKDPAVAKIPHENICYRCPDEVIEHCSRLLEKNINRVAKEWHKSGREGSVSIEQFMNDESSDSYILNEIQRIQTSDSEASILVLSPMGLACESLRKKMSEAHWDFNDCWDAERNMEAVVNSWWLNAIYSKNKLPFLIFLHKHYNHFGKERLKRYLKERFEKGYEKESIHNELIELGYLPEELTTLIKNPPTIEELCSLRPEFGELYSLLDPEDPITDIPKLISKLSKKNEFERGKINLMSIHRSKGLQAEYVFINGLVSGILPNESIGLQTIEAQRRLLFVGMSRAQKELHLVSTVEWTGKHVHKVDKSKFEYRFREKKYRGKTSRFIEEMIK